MVFLSLGADALVLGRDTCAFSGRTQLDAPYERAFCGCIMRRPYEYDRSP